MGIAEIRCIVSDKKLYTALVALEGLTLQAPLVIPTSMENGQARPKNKLVSTKKLKKAAPSSSAKAPNGSKKISGMSVVLNKHFLSHKPETITVNEAAAVLVKGGYNKGSTYYALRHFSSPDGVKLHQSGKGQFKVNY